MKWKEEETNKVEKSNKPVHSKGTNFQNPGQHLEENTSTRRRNQVIPINRKECKIPEEIFVKREQNGRKVFFADRRRMPRFKRKNQQSRFPNKVRRSESSERFEVGTLDKLRISRTTSLASVPSNVTIIPETQINDSGDEDGKNFLYYGQGARNQDHQ